MGGAGATLTSVGTAAGATTSVVPSGLAGAAAGAAAVGAGTTLTSVAASGLADASAARQGGTPVKVTGVTQGWTARGVVARQLARQASACKAW